MQSHEAGVHDNIDLNFFYPSIIVKLFLMKIALFQLVMIFLQ